MKLSELLKKITYIQISGNPDIEIESITFDSREAKEGSLFFAIGGNLQDGHQYIPQCIEKGVNAFVYQDEKWDETFISKGVSAIRVENSRLALSFIAASFYGEPGGKLNLVGVTGTNGKTSIATLLYRLFTDLGYCCGLISTICNYVGPKIYPTEHTTPDPITLNKLMAEMVESGCQYAFMEVSSHSIDQDRTTALPFRGAIFTNLTHDHLDYHKTFANYLKSKKRLFDELSKDAFALVNIDDKNGKVMIQNTNASTYTYSARSISDFKVKIIEKSIEGSLLNINGKEVWTRFIGVHNAHNVCAVYGCATLLGAEEDEILRAISNLQAAPGRLEYIKGGNNITAVIDYAHTPDALENTLKSLKGVSEGNPIVTVFGCGGDRDKTKRPEMGKIAVTLSDRVVVTSDNPRNEEPVAIMNDIKEGMDIPARAKSLFISDRKEAIRCALMTAVPGSIVLIAGKGHEDYQIIKGVKHHFDDKEIVSQIFNEMTL